MASDECLFNDIRVLTNSDDNNGHLSEQQDSPAEELKEKHDDSSSSDPGDFECEIYEYSLDSKYLDYLYENLSYDRLIDREEFI